MIALGAAMLIACGSKKVENNPADQPVSSAIENPVEFNADSAYAYIRAQVDFGPRVPNSEAHRKTSEWLERKLREFGGNVSVQSARLTAFDGTLLNAKNIIAQYNPEETDRTLLVAHWDSRPWADADPDIAKHSTPVDGANDGASSVGVILELARQFSLKNPGKGVDILFVDAEDYGSEGDDDSWALGAQYFVTHPFKPSYCPARVILLDMVGGENATFRREFFSQQNYPDLCDEIWSVAAASGYSNYFLNKLGGAVNDDHIHFIKSGIPAIDIIDYREDTGFHPTWHTSADNMQVISRPTLKAVGQTLINYIYR